MKIVIGSWNRRFYGAKPSCTAKSRGLWCFVLLGLSGRSQLLISLLPATHPCCSFSVALFPPFFGIYIFFICDGTEHPHGRY